MALGARHRDVLTLYDATANQGFHYGSVIGLARIVCAALPPTRPPMMSGFAVQDEHNDPVTV